MMREEIHDSSYPDRFPKRQVSRNNSFSKPQLIQPPIVPRVVEAVTPFGGEKSPTSISDLPATPPAPSQATTLTRSRSDIKNILSALENDDALDADNDPISKGSESTQKINDLPLPIQNLKESLFFPTSDNRDNSLSIRFRKRGPFMNPGDANWTDIGGDSKSSAISWIFFLFYLHVTI
jgi:hypothetical protein